MTSSPAHEQVADLLALLSDEGSYRIVQRLIESEATAAELVDADVPGLDQSGVSRRLRELRLAGLIRGRGGRNAVHRYAHPSETIELLRAAITLSQAVNERRQQDGDEERRRLAATDLRREPKDESVRSDHRR